jgi:hypothetical protein
MLILTQLRSTCCVFAYIDPNAGGSLFQLLFPLYVAICGVWIVFKKKLTGLRLPKFRRKSKEREQHKS